MMSRITLHLRKQARSRENDTVLQAYSVGTQSASIRSRLRFKRSGGQASLDPVSVAVEESTVMHDDRGNVVGERVFSKKSRAAEEWYEMRPPPPARVASSRARMPKEADPELRFVV